MKEVWKWIKGFEGKYQVSSEGRVKSFLKTKQGKILAESNDTKNYKIIGLCKKTKKIHRLVAQAFICNSENKPQINHINCDKSDNSVYNLEWVTNKENAKHAINNGIFAFIKGGDSHHNAKINTKIAKQIKYDLLKPNYRGKIKDIQKKFGVSKSIVLAIKNNITWVEA
jgi:hypothetical protein